MRTKILEVESGFERATWRTELTQVHFTSFSSKGHLTVFSATMATMLRTSGLGLVARAARAAANGVQPRGPGQSGRGYSGQAGGQSGGGGKAVAVTAALTLTVAGGTVGYAALDAEFRKNVEEVVPGAETALGAILGEKELEKPPPPPTSAKKSIPVTSAPPSKKRTIKVEEKKEEEIVAKKVENTKGDDTTLVIVTPPPLEKPAPVELEPEKVQSTPKNPKKLAPEAPGSVEEAKKAIETQAALEEDIQRKKAATVDVNTSKKKAKKPVSVAQQDEQEEDVQGRAIMAGKDLHRQLTRARQEMEDEMVAQLRRQAEAHADHLSDELGLQEQELRRQLGRQQDEALERSELQYRDQLARVTGHLRGLNVGLRGRADADRASLQAQELWLASAAALDAVSSGANPGGAEVRSLNKELSALEAAAGNADPLAKALLASIPAEASQRGVYTEDSIRERFRRVEKLAKRTALVGDEGGSLARYALSYLQSVLVMSPGTDEPPPSKQSPVDVDALGTFDLVWLAKSHLERGDLTQAVRYVGLLKGEPGNVARDWLTEARLLLETRQACRALLAHAAATGVEALPPRAKDN